MDKTKKNFVSLFSGAMGLDIGLENSGHWECAYCLDNDEDAIKTIKLNRPELPLYSGSIVNIYGAEILKSINLPNSTELDLVVGGPPCQAFSVFGKREGIEDLRGQMTLEFLRMIKELRPKMFLMENVRGLLSMPLVPKKNQNKNDTNTHLHKKGSLLKMLFEEYNLLGYNVDCYVVNAVNYGAPQIRERILLIGNRFNKLSDFPDPQFSNRREDALPPFKTLGDVIGPDTHFRDPDPEIMNFSPRKLNYLKQVPPGGNWRSLPLEVQKESMGKSWYLKGGRSAYWRKLSFDFPSPTVVTMPNHAGTSMCHPIETRAITVGEASTIQGFPSDWKFFGTPTSKFRQIGNAVPVKLGQVAGDVLFRLLQNINNNSGNNIEKPSSRIIHLRPHVRTKTYWRNGKSFSGSVSYYNYGEKAIDSLVQPALF